MASRSASCRPTRRERRRSWPLAIAEELDGDLHGEIEAAKLSLDWAARTIGDAPVELPDAGALRARIGPRAAADTRVWAGGGTTYLCAVDGERNAVSWIQSIFEGFGAGVAVGDTGIALHNRGAGFTEEEGHPNRIAPGKRPFHTIIPGLLLRDGRLPGPFGVMGGSMQAQAHFQLVRHVVDGGLDPQAALDAARFRALGGAPSRSSRASPRWPTTCARADTTCTWPRRRTASAWAR